MDEVLGSPGRGGGKHIPLWPEWQFLVCRMQVCCPLGAAKSISPGARPSSAVQRTGSWVVVSGGRSNSLVTLIPVTDILPLGEGVGGGRATQSWPGGLAGQARAAIVRARGKEVVGAGIRTPRNPYSQDGVDEWNSQAVVSKGAFVQTLDGAWEKLRQVGPARIGHQPVLAHSSSEVRVSIYWMPTAPPSLSESRLP